MEDQLRKAAQLLEEAADEMQLLKEALKMSMEYGDRLNKQLIEFRVEEAKRYSFLGE
jgi:hypothetical protein